MPNRIKIFSGNANRTMAEEICRRLQVPLSAAEVKKFSDGEIFVEIGETSESALFLLFLFCCPRQFFLAFFK